jgi:hypothetical protein
MSAMCKACKQRPAGIEGHEKLFAERIGSSQMSFQCSECQSRWGRRYLGEGAFQWEFVDPSSPAGDRGISLPRS